MDADGDGHNWGLALGQDAQNGSGMLVSYSYINNIGSLNTNNYAITPEISLNGFENVYVDFYTASIDDSYREDIRVLYGSTNNPSQMTTAINLQEVPANWTKYTINLNNYNATTLYIAFQHQKSGYYAIKIDNIQVHGDYVGS